jgi:polyisoprenoid-binding protein YceI
MAEGGLLMAEPPHLQAGDWRVAPADSQLGFLTRIMFGLMPVRGRYSAYEGELHVDDAGNASGVLQVQAETISTGIKKRDKHLRSTDFFAVERHPHLRFELASLVPSADGAATLTGTLQIRDQALAINTPVSVANVGSDGLRINADFEVDHHAAGFEFKKLPRTVRIQAGLTLQRSS